MYNARIMAIYGFFGGIAKASMNSGFRLAGILENDDEVRRFGSISASEMREYIAKKNNLHVELVDETIVKPQPKH